MAGVEQESRLFDGHTTWAIPGNHDCQYSDLEYLDSSALGNWFETGLVKRLSEEVISIEKYRIQFLGWEFGDLLPKASADAFSVLVGHAFYESAPIKGKDLVITEDEIVEGGYDIVVLGHDHAKYSPITLDNGYFLFPRLLQENFLGWKGGDSGITSLKFKTAACGHSKLHFEN
ncbi:unnamed protein product, partial [marine sediment metagenome]